MDPVSPPRWKYEGAMGRAEVGSAGPGVVLIVLSGRVDADMAGHVTTRIRAVFEQQAAAGSQFHAFWDLGQLEHYHPSLRVECTRALREHFAHVASIHALSTSKIVRMGVAVANLALDYRIKAYNQRLHFEHALDEALGRPRAESLPPVNGGMGR